MQTRNALRLRNMEIYQEIMSGKTRVSLVEKYGISNNRISQIFEREKLNQKK